MAVKRRKNRSASLAAPARAHAPAPSSAAAVFTAPELTPLAPEFTDASLAEVAAAPRAADSPPERVPTKADLTQTVRLGRRTLELPRELVADPFAAVAAADSAPSLQPPAVAAGARSEESLRPMTLDDEFFASPSNSNAADVDAATGTSVHLASNLEATDSELAAKRLSRLGDKTVVERREKSRRFVMMGLSAMALVFGVGGVIRATIRSHESNNRDAHVSAAAVASEPAAVMNAAEIAPAAVAPPNSVQAAPMLGEGVDVPAPETVAAAPAEEVVPVLTEKERRELARKSKLDSQRGLDRGDNKAAIAAGEQSVETDPTDAEAWLILGAAYQQSGDHKNAARAFHSCISEGKRGDKSDCVAMLRGGN